MNKFLFLPPSSCHPPHIFSGWVLGYGRRLRLNCTDDSDYNNNLLQFKANLLQRGYSEEMITETFTAIPERSTIIRSIKQGVQDNHTNSPANIGVPFVVTYSPAIRSSLPLIKKAIALSEEAQLDQHFPVIFGASTTPLLSFKRGRNLRDLVAPSSFH